MEADPVLGVFFSNDERGRGRGEFIGHADRGDGLDFEVVFASFRSFDEVVAERNVDVCAGVAGVVEVFGEGREGFVLLADAEVGVDDRLAISVFAEGCCRVGVYCRVLLMTFVVIQVEEALLSKKPYIWNKSKQRDRKSVV